MIVQHYKGGIYSVIIDGTSVTDSPEQNKGVLRGFHTETQEYVFAYRVISDTWYTEKESLVFYRNEDGVMFARPTEMFWSYGYFRDKDVIEPRFNILATEEMGSWVDVGKSDKE